MSVVVKDCSWDATYELRTTTESGKPSSSVALHYLATVKQRTGEDWTNAVLTLSTNQTDMLPKSLPRIGRFQIRQARPLGNLFGPPSKGVVFRSAAQNNANTSRFQQQVTGGSLFGGPPNQASASNAMPGAAFGSNGLFGQSNPATTSLFGGFGGSVDASSFATGVAPPPPPPAVFAQDTTVQETPFGATAMADPEQASPDDFEEVLYEEGPSDNNTQPTVVVKETPLSMNFSVSETANIPSDGLGHQVTLAVIPFQTKISHITIPRIDPRIYLQVRALIIFSLIIKFQILMIAFSVMSRTLASTSCFRDPSVSLLTIVICQPRSWAM